MLLTCNQISWLLIRIYITCCILFTYVFCVLSHCTCMWICAKPMFLVAFAVFTVSCYLCYVYFIISKHLAIRLHLKTSPFACLFNIHSGWKHLSFSSPVRARRCSDWLPCCRSPVGAESAGWRSPSPPGWHSPSSTLSLPASDPAAVRQMSDHKHACDIIISKWKRWKQSWRQDCDKIKFLSSNNPWNSCWVTLPVAPHPQEN